MPAKSEAQRRLMGAVYGAKKEGHCDKMATAKVQKMCESMSKGQLREFAKK